MRFWTLLGRCLRLRCPLCGQGKLFDGLLKMRASCSHCGLKFEREPGFFLGSIYFNYGLTALVVVVAYPILMFNQILPESWLLLGAWVGIFAGSLLLNGYLGLFGLEVG